MRTDDHDPGMGMIVKTVAQGMKGFILLFGIYIVHNGHLTPGGGFAGGVIIACAFVMLTLAGGESYGLGCFSKRAASSLVCVGLLIFLAVAWLGTWRESGVFFENFITTSADARFTAFSAGTIPISDIGVGLLVASSLFLVFTVLAAVRLASRRDKEEIER